MKKSSLIIPLLFIASLSFAQMGSLALTVGVPQNEFRENTDATGGGFDLSIAFPFQKDVPIFLGLDINYLVYGSNSQNEDLTADIRTSNGSLIDQLVIPLRITNTNSIFGTHAFIRVVAPFELIQPYAEGLIGFRYISTDTKILDRSNDGRYSDEDDNVIIRKTVLDDWIFSYGYGGGFLIKIGNNAFLDLRADFFRGQRAQYYDGDDTESWSVEFTGSESAYDPENLEKGDLDFSTEPRESTTDLLMIKLGLAIKF